MTKYKVGDYLVAKTQFENSELVKVVRVDLDGGIYDEKWRLLLIWKLRHATPEEIKAGKRLCTHSMTEITVFGDLKRTYKCEKCGHEEYEEWVSHD